MPAPRKYPDELRQRAVRLYRESDPKPVIKRLAGQLGVHPEALRNWIRQDQADHGERFDQPTTAEAEELRGSAKRTLSCAEPTRSSRPPQLFSHRNSTRPGKLRPQDTPSLPPARTVVAMISGRVNTERPTGRTVLTTSGDREGFALADGGRERLPEPGVREGHLLSAKWPERGKLPRHGRSCLQNANERCHQTC
ncbi:transposase [Catellatospora sp. NPDC049609]|uniref:transposase n=1 Tax=Catellatospora sp. NPDC049609 TaxID=3155505 RepID=UPI0034307806